MKNKILSYLFGWFLAILLVFSYWYVHADDCVCPENDPGCKQCNYPWATKPSDNWEWCWEVPEWFICCDWEYKVSAEIGCEGVVVKWCKDWCCGIKLNTDFPIIWNCIGDSENENETNAFPTMIWAITKIVMSLVFVVCFIMIIYAWILWAADKPKDAKDWLKRVAITILLLWFSWAILRLINPNFFS